MFAPPLLPPQPCVAPATNANPIITAPKTFITLLDMLSFPPG
jgi:hypothetical protein